MNLQTFRKVTGLSVEASAVLADINPETWRRLEAGEARLPPEAAPLFWRRLATRGFQMPRNHLDPGFAPERSW